MTILLEILVVAAIVFGVVAYAIGGLEGMRPAPPDSGEVGLPQGPLGADAVERTRFGLAFRGYRMDEVDGVLDRLRDELSRRDAELAGLRVADDDADEDAADGSPTTARWPIAGTADPATAGDQHPAVAGADVAAGTGPALATMPPAAPSTPVDRTDTDTDTASDAASGTASGIAPDAVPEPDPTVDGHPT